jgi:HK97 family phage portal protein
MTIPGLAFIGKLFNKGKNLFTSLFNIGGGTLVYPDMNQERAIKDGYEGNGAVYSIVKKDAKKFASIPRYVYAIKGKEREKVENELSNLLNRPNEYQGQDAFLEAVRGFYQVTGESFIWLNRGDVKQRFDAMAGTLVDRTDKEIDAMPVVEMYVMPSNHVYLIPDPKNAFGILGYEFEIGGTRIPIRKNDVIHWRSTNMTMDAYGRQHLRGMPALKPGKKFLQQDNDGTDSAVRMHQNDGARGIAFNETFDDLTIQQQSDVRDVTNKRINNNDIKGAIATVQGKWGYINFGGTAVDMELINALVMSKENLCMLFDVPYELFTIKVTYENKDKAQRGWIYNSIIPASKQLDDELNRLLLTAFSLTKNYKIACDYTELPEMQQDMEKLVNLLDKAWWLTPNEKRKAMAYEESSEKEMNEVWVPSGYTPLSQLGGDGFDEMVNSLASQGITN